MLQKKGEWKLTDLTMTGHLCKNKNKVKYENVCSFPLDEYTSGILSV